MKMPQKLTQQQIQEQRQQTLQRLSQQQMLQVKLLEMPLAQLEQSVNSEMDDNPALERSVDEESYAYDEPAADVTENFEQMTEREEREQELERALDSLDSDDRMPEYHGYEQQQSAEQEEMVWGATTSFYDTLREQMGEYELDEVQQIIMQYLIGSLDEDGLLRKDSVTLSEELSIKEYIDVTPEVVEQMLQILQQFDPAGIGAHDLQECLLLQIARLPETEVRRLTEEVILHHFDDFRKKHWTKIQRDLNLSDAMMEEVQAEIRHLNPKPGSSLGETLGRSTQQIIPDFIVDTHEDGTVTFTINGGHIPELHVAESYVDTVKTFREHRDTLSRRDKEALLYAKEKVDRARGFIEALRQRQQTLYLTMKTIIDMQHRFFEEGDEGELRPMILKDVADRTGLDISTISRVSNQKYAQTRWGTYPLKFFFSDGYTTDDGQELSVRKMKSVLREIIDAEDKRHPLSDEAIRQEMNKRGFPLARRTVTKYRESMGIPKAIMRR